MKKAFAEKELRVWLGAGKYCFLILVETEQRKDEIIKALDRAIRFGDESRLGDAEVMVESVTPLNELETALHALLQTQTNP
jgi:hypothetical protein